MSQANTAIPTQELPPEHTESPEQKVKGTGKVETFETSLVGERKAKLRSDGPEVELTPVNVSSLVESTSNLMSKTDQAEAARAGEMMAANDDEEAIQVVEQQIDKGQASGQKLLLFSEACRQFGQVYAVKGEVNMAKYGNQIDTEGSGEFVIPKSRGAEMQGLLKNLCGGLGEAGGSFHVETANTLDKKDGFEATYHYTKNGKPETIKFTFFYYDDSVERALQEKAQQKAAAESKQKQTPEAAPAETNTDVVSEGELRKLEEEVAQKRAEREELKKKSAASTEEKSGDTEDLAKAA